LALIAAFSFSELKIACDDDRGECPEIRAEHSDEEDSREKTQKTQRIRDEQRPEREADPRTEFDRVATVFFVPFVFFAAILLSRHRMCRAAIEPTYPANPFRTGSVAAIKRFPFEGDSQMSDPGIFR
jgi:hypothetical protein